VYNEDRRCRTIELNTTGFISPWAIKAIKLTRFADFVITSTRLFTVPISFERGERYALAIYFIRNAKQRIKITYAESARLQAGSKSHAVIKYLHSHFDDGKMHLAKFYFKTQERTLMIIIIIIIIIIIKQQ